MKLKDTLRSIIREEVKRILKEEKYWVVAKDKRGELYVFNDGYYNTKEEADNALKNITVVPKYVDATTIKVEPVPTKPDYTIIFNNLSK
jgi:collagenase-like PrtC family protease